MTSGLHLKGEGRTISFISYCWHAAYSYEFFIGPLKYFKPGKMLLALIYEKNSENF